VSSGAGRRANSQYTGDEASVVTSSRTASTLNSSIHCASSMTITSGWPAAWLPSVVASISSVG
jgi:hypothetical protein